MSRVLIVFTSGNTDRRNSSSWCSALHYEQCGVRSCGRAVEVDRSSIIQPISLKFPTNFDHVTLHVPRTFRVNGSKSQCDITYQHKNAVTQALISWRTLSKGPLHTLNQMVNQMVNHLLSC